jgi:hypothetical protein
MNSASPKAQFAAVLPPIRGVNLMRNTKHGSHSSHVALVLHPTSFAAFLFNDSCQYTLYLNFRPIIFYLTFFDWLRSITLTLHIQLFLMGIPFLIYAYF